MRSRTPTGTTKYKTQSETGAVASQVSTKPQESALTPPEARGLLSDTIKRGTLSKKPKILLKPCKNQSRKTTARSQQILRFARGLAPKPHAKGQKLPAPPRPRPERPRTGCQFSDSLEAGLGKQPRYLRPDRTPLTKRHVRINTPNYSRKRQPHAGTVRAERPTGQGTGRSRGYLPLCSSLCSLLTPVLPCAT